MISNMFTLQFSFISRHVHSCSYSESQITFANIIIHWPRMVESESSSLCCLTLETPWTVAQQAPLSVGFPRQEYEWVAMSFLKGSSQPRDWTCIFCIADRFFTTEPLVESFKSWCGHSSATCSYKVYLTSLGFNSEKAMAPHSSTLAWKLPWTEEPGRLQSMGSWRVRHDWAFAFMHWRRKWQPTPAFLPGESQGLGSLVGCRLWGRTESDMTEAT